MGAAFKRYLDALDDLLAARELRRSTPEFEAMMAARLNELWHDLNEEEHAALDAMWWLEGHGRQA